MCTNVFKKKSIDDVIKTNNYVSIGICPRVCINIVGFNTYFFPRRTNLPLKTTNHGIRGKSIIYTITGKVTVLKMTW